MLSHSVAPNAFFFGRQFGKLFQWLALDFHVRSRLMLSTPEAAFVEVEHVENSPILAEENGQFRADQCDHHDNGQRNHSSPCHTADNDKQVQFKR